MAILSIRNKETGEMEEVLCLRGEKGEPGQNATDEQVASAVEQYLIDNPIVGGIQRIESDANDPLRFIEMESGVYIMRGTFKDCRVYMPEYFKHYETEFVFDEDTLVSLRVNPSADFSEVAAIAMISRVEDSLIEIHEVRRSGVSAGYESMNKWLKVDSSQFMTANDSYGFPPLDSYEDLESLPVSKFYFDPDLKTVLIRFPFQGVSVIPYTILHTTENAYSKTETDAKIDEKITNALEAVENGSY